MFPIVLELSPRAQPREPREPEEGLDVYSFCVDKIRAARAIGGPFGREGTKAKQGAALSSTRG
eukprot:734945-Prorocentrum_minimum.AAC.1